MRLLEFQAKELFGQFGIKTPKGKYSNNIEQAREHAKELGFPFVIKFQAPVGGRGKAGGIQVVKNQDEFELKYPQVAGMTIKGEKARAILRENGRIPKRAVPVAVFEPLQAMLYHYCIR